MSVRRTLPFALPLLLILPAWIPAREPSGPGDRPRPLDCTGDKGVDAADVRKAQEAWAKYLGRKAEEEVEVAGGVKMTFVLVPPGKFRMGSPDGEKERGEDEVLHEVTLTEPFDLGKYEVTQAQYEALTGKNPSQIKGAEQPVEQVSWDEARDFGDRLTKKRADKHTYRLPTEAEWEYACRGGRPVAQPFGIGDGRTLSSDQANFNGGLSYGTNPGPFLQRTTKVGSYAANTLGLYDMNGNVWEWCADWYDSFTNDKATDPKGPAASSFRIRVFRGGGWSSFGWSCRAACRSGDAPGTRGSPLGFRLARTLPPPGK